MNLFKRALLYTIRKKGKSLIIFLVLLITTTFALSGLSIRDASQTAALNLRQSLGGGFEVHMDTSNSKNFSNFKNSDGNSGIKYTGQFLDRAAAEKIKSVPGISSYNAESTEYAEFKDANLNYLKLIKTNDLFANEQDMENVGKVVGNTNTEYNTYFSNGNFKISEGRHINGKDKGVAIINKELAQQNNLKLGDYIVLSMSDTLTANNADAAKKSIKLKIIGIFDTVTKQADTEFTTSNLLVQNMVFIDIDTCEDFYSWDYRGYQHANYFVNDPGKIPSIIDTVKKLGVIDLSSLKIDIKDTDYEKAAQPLHNLNNLITTLIIIIILISIAVLSLLLSMWIRTRVHESGILLSIGISKVKIVLQYIVEVLMIAVIAFGVSYFSSRAIAQGVGNSLLQYSSSNINNDNQGKKNPFDDSPVLQNGNTKITNIKVNVQADKLGWVYMMGTLVIVISVFISSAPILKLKPKEILTKMS